MALMKMKMKMRMRTNISTNIHVLVCVLVSLCLLLTRAHPKSATYNYQAWQSAGQYPVPSDFPENQLNGSKTKTTGIAISGGGINAYSMAMGMLSALDAKGYMKNVDYVAGVSGGNWATAVYSYAQKLPSQGSASKPFQWSDQTLLGPVVPPEELTMDKLSEMNTDCARARTNNDWIATLMKAFTMSLNKIQLASVGVTCTRYGYESKECIAAVIPLVLTGSSASAWESFIGSAYLEPYSIDSNPFSLDQATVTGIQDLQGSGSLDTQSFLYPRPGRPYMILSMTLLGPQLGGDLQLNNRSFYQQRNYSILEVTPLYAGNMRAIVVDHGGNELLTQQTGGVVTPYIFGSTAPLSGLGGQQTAVLGSSTKPNWFTLAEAASISSYAPAAMFSLFPELKFEVLQYLVNYWSPVPKIPVAASTVMGDGYALQNTPVINMLQRGITKVLMMVAAWEIAGIPTAAQWPLSEIQADPCLPPAPYVTNVGLTAFFGCGGYSLDQDSRSDQVFKKSDLVEVITNMQAAQAAGYLPMSHSLLTTVQNVKNGIKAGMEVSLGVIYGGRSSKWEGLLPVGGGVLEAINSGELNCYTGGSSGGGQNYSQANYLANQVGWNLMQNVSNPGESFIMSVFQATPLGPVYDADDVIVVTGGDDDDEDPKWKYHPILITFVTLGSLAVALCIGYITYRLVYKPTFSGYSDTYTATTNPSPVQLEMRNVA